MYNESDWKGRKREIGDEEQIIFRKSKNASKRVRQESSRAVSVEEDYGETSTRARTEESIKESRNNSLNEVIQVSWLSQHLRKRWKGEKV